MSLQIKSIEPSSLADKAGILPGEKIIELNGEKIRDFLDLDFYASDFRLDFVIQTKNGEQRELTIFRETAVPLGIVPIDYRHRNCNNHCIFCFIDQMPPGMRKTLYAKDDDYIYSFVYGNYITLTNLKEEDIQRICDQHLSPLYVSLHTSDQRLRQFMIRSARKTSNALEIMKRLSLSDISFHVQLVIVPGFNDGVALKHSIFDLGHPDLNVQSIGVVPVGLTKYRDRLCQLEPFNEEQARDLLSLLNEISLFTSIEHIYPADEFFVLAKVEIPDADFYEDYPQLENGIGMLRYGEDSFKKKKRAFLKELRSRDSNYHFLCSNSASNLLERIVRDLSKRLPDRLLSLQIIRNVFFGEHISVAGLITAQDIAEQAEIPKESTVVLPSCIFNHEGITLDGKSIVELRDIIGRDLLVVDPFWESWQRFC